MAEGLVEIRSTLERVLDELLARGNQVLDNVYMDKMVTHLSGKNGEGSNIVLESIQNRNIFDSDFSAILKSPFLLDWVNRSFNAVNTTRQNAQLYAFTLRVLSLIMENEWQFLNVMETDMCTR